MKALKAYNKSHCEKCRENMMKEYEEAIKSIEIEAINKSLDEEYNEREKVAESERECIFEQAFTLFFSALLSETIDEDLCKRVYNKTVLLSSMTHLFDKKLTSDDYNKTLAEMGIDLSRIEYHHETCEEFKSRFWKEQKENNND